MVNCSSVDSSSLEKPNIYHYLKKIKCVNNGAEVRRIRLNKYWCNDSPSIASSNNYVAVLMDSENVDQLCLIPSSLFFPIDTDKSFDENFSNNNVSVEKKNNQLITINTCIKQLTDWQFSPKEDTNISLLATGGESMSGNNLKLWEITNKHQSEEIESTFTPSLQYAGHKSKCSSIAFSPIFTDYLVTGGNDKLVKCWNFNSVNTSLTRSRHPFQTIRLDGVVSNLTWSSDTSSLISACCRSRFNKLCLIDLREFNTIASTVYTHKGCNQSKCCFLNGDYGNSRIILTCGFGKYGDTEYQLWDTAQLKEPIDSGEILSDAVNCPSIYWDHTTGLLVASARGCNKISCLYYDNASMSIAKVKNIDLPLPSDQCNRGLTFFPNKLKTEYINDTWSGVFIAGNSVVKNLTLKITNKLTLFQRLPISCHKYLHHRDNYNVCEDIENNAASKKLVDMSEIKQLQNLNASNYDNAKLLSAAPVCEIGIKSELDSDTEFEDNYEYCPSVISSPRFQVCDDKKCTNIQCTHKNGVCKVDNGVHSSTIFKKLLTFSGKAIKYYLIS